MRASQRPRNRQYTIRVAALYDFAHKAVTFNMQNAPFGWILPDLPVRKIYLQPGCIEWCEQHLGYVPQLVNNDLLLLFRSDADVAYFTLAWR